MSTPKHTPPSGLEPDLAEAQRFLDLLDPQAEFFTFQTFDDRKGRDRPDLISVLHGTLAQCAPELARRNAQGAGVFVTVNATDRKGRKAENISRVRAIFHEDDEGVFGPALDFLCQPSIEVVSSGDHVHRYWLVDGLTRDEFAGVMRTMVERFHSDPYCKDVSRVLRVPGFWHRKVEPSMVRILEASGKRYSPAEILKAFPPIAEKEHTPQPDRKAPVGEPTRDAYALAGLEAETLKLSDTLPGTPGVPGSGRNHALNVAAVKLFGFVAANRLAHAEVETALLKACDLNGLAKQGGNSAVRATLKSGMKKGLTQPRWEGLHPSSDAEADFGTVDLRKLSAGETPRGKSYWFDEQPLIVDIPWLVDDAIPEQSVGFLAAKSGMGKTFLVIELALCTAFGLPFFGRKIARRGGAHIIAAEGGYSLQARISAALNSKFAELAKAEGHNPACVPISYDKEAPDLLTEKGLAAFIEQLREDDKKMREEYGVPLSLVIVDTFGQTFSLKDENAAADVSRATRAMKEIVSALGVTVISTHHYGKNEKADMRGSSALRANADFVLAVKTARQLRLDKCRDAAQDIILGYFDMPIVDVGKKKNGDPITSRYINVASEWDDLLTVEPPNHSEVVFEQSVAAMLEAKGVEQAPNGEGATGRMVRLEDVRLEFYRRWAKSDETNRKAFLRVREKLPAGYQIDKWDSCNWVWMSPAT